MAINSVGSNVILSRPVALPASESREVGKDHDGDADDSVGKASPSVLANVPTVNPHGQVVGAGISTKV